MKKLFCEKCGQVWFISNKHSDTVCDFCGSSLTEKISTRSFNDVSEGYDIADMPNSTFQSQDSAISSVTQS